MVPNLFFYQLAVVALVWLCVMLHWVWPSDRATVQPTPPQSMPPRRHHREKEDTCVAHFLTCCRAANLGETRCISSPVQGASPAQTRAASRPSRAHGHHLRSSTNCEKLSDIRMPLTVSSGLRPLPPAGDAGRSASRQQKEEP